MQLIKWQFGLNLFQYGFSFLTLVLPSAIIANEVLAGNLEVGRAIQAAGAFAAILAALTIIVEHFESLSRFAAGIDRLHAFAATLAVQPQRAITTSTNADSTNATVPATTSARNSTRESRDDQTIELQTDARLSLHRLTVLTPDRMRTLISDLSIAIDPGDGLMIVGASGGGKSSLLRAIAGLCRAGSGRVMRPSGDDILFLPQLPYMTTGSLRSQLLYPDDERQVSDDALLQLLDRVNLAELSRRSGGLDTVRDWSKVLSVGEQQRLAFARALLIRPRYLMLDEASSALDADNEQMLYRAMVGDAMTPVSVSHHPALLPFHSRVLELTGRGNWAVHDAGSWRFDGTQ